MQRFNHRLTVPTRQGIRSGVERFLQGHRPVCDGIHAYTSVGPVTVKINAPTGAYLVVASGRNAANSAARWAAPVVGSGDIVPLGNLALPIRKGALSVAAWMVHGATSGLTTVGVGTEAGALMPDSLRIGIHPVGSYTGTENPLSNNRSHQGTSKANNLVGFSPYIPVTNEPLPRSALWAFGETIYGGGDIVVSPHDGLFLESSCTVGWEDIPSISPTEGKTSGQRIAQAFVTVPGGTGRQVKMAMKWNLYRDNGVTADYSGIIAILKPGMTFLPGLEHLP